MVADAERKSFDSTNETREFDKGAHAGATLVPAVSWSGPPGGGRQRPPLTPPDPSDGRVRAVALRGHEAGGILCREAG
jgi:hypothetical protein